MSFNPIQAAASGPEAKRREDEEFLADLETELQKITYQSGMYVCFQCGSCLDQIVLDIHEYMHAILQAHLETHMHST
jgi:hypothetical protein